MVLDLSRAAALRWLAVLLLLLLVGTQMPGVWRDAVEQSFHAPFGLTSLGHFLVFAAMAFVARLPALNLSAPVLWGSASLLAGLTEMMQLWATDRHPSWGDVWVDLAGVAAGWLVQSWLRQRSVR